ncbi:unnamed protein product [Amaranthus hypochondriacus]
MNMKTSIKTFIHENTNTNRLIKSTLILCSLFLLSIFALLITFSSLPFSHFSFFSSPSSCCNLSDPNPGPTLLTHIQFGLAGSSKTWETRQAYTQLWWVPNKTRGFIWLDDDPPPKPIKQNPNIPPVRISGRRKIKPGSSKNHQDSDRIARIVMDSFDQKLAGIKWFVMGDDDTVFFTENLVNVLSKYDYREMYYIGAPSESVEQDVMHGYETGFGGGGFAISYGLACELVKIMDGCIERYHHFYGSDEKVSACVAELGVPLTKQPGFHQLDVRGDPYGLLAAHPVAPLVSLHHLVNAKPLFPGENQLDSIKKLIRAYHVNPGLTLQQSFCYDRKHKWSVSVSWGYTAQLYPSLLSPKVLSMPLQTFHTWRSKSDGPFVFNTRAMKDDPCERPIIFYFDQVKVIGDGKTISTYKRVAPADGKECLQPAYKLAMSVEQMTVSASKTAPDKWKKALRRECCEIQNKLPADKNMRITIRSCKPRESIYI